MIYFKKLTDTAMIPKRQSEGAAGFDLYADEDTQIWPNEQKLIKTGISCKIPDSWCGQIWPRSGLSKKFELDRKAGLIDSDFTGEVKVIIRNEGNKPFTIEAGMRIAQLVVIPFMCVGMEVSSIPETKRGAGSFGSTGK